MVCDSEADLISPLRSHPGPSNNVGRGAPEIAVLEGTVNLDGLFGEMTQCKPSLNHAFGEYNTLTIPSCTLLALQLAPFNNQQWVKNTSDVYMLGEDFETRPNEFIGNSYQQVCFYF